MNERDIYASVGNAASYFVEEVNQNVSKFFLIHVVNI